MILTRENIIAEIGFEPKLDVFQVNPHSVDLRASVEVTLMPGVTSHVQTMEKVALPGDVMGVVYPRSSTNRRFIALDMTGVVDANYSGHLMMPMTNCTEKPIRILRGERVAQIVFQRLEKQAPLRLSKYHGTDGAYLPDKSEETALLESGDLDALKAKYAL